MKLIAIVKLPTQFFCQSFTDGSLAAAGQYETARLYSFFHNAASENEELLKNSEGIPHKQRFT